MSSPPSREVPADKFYVPTHPERPIFQGDIFRCAFGAFWRHPESMRLQRERALRDPKGPFPFPEEGQLRAHARLTESSFAMVLPHPCDYSEGEKGELHPFRVVAPVLPLEKNSRLVRAGRVGWQFYLPPWDDSDRPHCVDLHYVTSIDQAFLTRGDRVACLSRPAWFTLADRLSRYFAGVALDAGAHATEQGDNYPDPPKHVP